jgi:hypothetical protein
LVETVVTEGADGEKTVAFAGIKKPAEAGLCKTVQLPVGRQCLATVDRP